MYESTVQFPVLSTPFFRREDVLLGHPHCETELINQPVKVECYGAVSSIYFDSTPAFHLAIDGALAQGKNVEINGDYSISCIRVRGRITIYINGRLKGTC
jgi:hypothetical protein